jgi:hypothetical protein
MIGTISLSNSWCRVVHVDLEIFIKEDVNVLPRELTNREWNWRIWKRFGPTEMKSPSLLLYHSEVRSGTSSRQTNSTYERWWNRRNGNFGQSGWDIVQRINNRSKLLRRSISEMLAEHFTKLHESSSTLSSSTPQKSYPPSLMPNSEGSTDWTFRRKQYWDSFILAITPVSGSSDDRLHADSHTLLPRARHSSSDKPLEWVGFTRHCIPWTIRSCRRYSHAISTEDKAFIEMLYANPDICALISRTAELGAARCKWVESPILDAPFQIFHGYFYDRTNPLENFTTRHSKTRDGHPKWYDPLTSHEASLQFGMIDRKSVV